MAKKAATYMTWLIHPHLVRGFTALIGGTVDFSEMSKAGCYE